MAESRSGSRPRIGAHVPVSGGFAAGLRYATGIGAEAIQVFVSNPRSWSLPAGDAAARDRAADEIRDQLAGAGLPVFVHTPYLINVGSADPVIRERSVASVRYSLDRGRAIGARGVVVHTGSAAGGDRDKSMRYARECLLPVLDSIPADGPDLLLEPMAGQGQLLCTSVAELGPYLEMLGWHARAGVCLDTCHVFSAGADLRAPGGAAAAMDELARVLGGAPGGGVPGGGVPGGGRSGWCTPTTPRTRAARAATATRTSAPARSAGRLSACSCATPRPPASRS